MKNKNNTDNTEMDISMEIKSALQWFKDNEIPAYRVDDNIYVQAGRDTDVQISTMDILYRAELHQGFVRD